MLLARMPAPLKPDRDTLSFTLSSDETDAQQSDAANRR
jgi:hypothetical protein